MPARSPAFVLIHVVWATRDRRCLLRPEFDEDLASILGKKARAVGCDLLAAGSASDHVHVLLRLDHAVALAHAVQRLKGATSYDVNHHDPLSEHFAWQAGYWAESLCPADLDPLARYLRTQRQHHDDSNPAERWQLATDGEPTSGGL
jgi:putative transposase